MSTDSQGRPLSDDGQWAWNGAEWVPAASAGSTSASAPVVAADPNATIIVPSPFAAGGAPGFNQPGQVPTPGYVAPAGGYGAAPTPSKSRKPLIFGIVGAVVVIVAVVVVLILTLGGSSKKKAALDGAFSCSVPGRSVTGVITFKASNTYSLDTGTGGSFALVGEQVAFAGGDLDGDTGTFDSATKTVKLVYKGNNLTCTAK